MSRREVRIAPGGARGPRPTGCGGRMGRTGSFAPTHLVIASQSAPRSKCPWGTDWRGNPFPHKGKDGFPRQCEHWLGMTARQRPLDKSGGMGIIINTRGRCDKRSAPFGLGFYWAMCPQKPSPARVAVFAFQSLDSYRDRMTQNMNRKHEKHTVTPLQKEVTDRLAMYTASLGCIISRSPVFVNSHRLTNPAGWI